jgi:glucokinase
MAEVCFFAFFVPFVVHSLGRLSNKLNMEKCVIAAVDLGGTHLRCALALKDEPVMWLTRRRVSTEAGAGPEGVVTQIHAELQHCFNEAGLDPASLAAVGCTVPGFTNAEAGIVVSAANLRGWQEVPLVKLLEEKIGVPATIENDVRAAAIGEYYYGAGKGSHSLIYLTISTGVSSGIIVEGKLLRGFHNVAGEIAYLVPEPAYLDQDWGHNGCLESLAAGVGIAREWARAQALSDPTAAEVSAQEVFQAAEAGNQVAQRIIARASDYLAQAAIALCLIIDPAVLIIGGGIAQHQGAMIDRLNRAIATALPFPPPLRLAQLGDDSPLSGVSFLAAQKVAAAL